MTRRTERTLDIVMFVVILLMLVVVGITDARERTVIWQGSCTFKSWAEGPNNNVVLRLNCGGKEAVTGNPKILLAYLENPGPIACQINEYRKVLRCEA